MNDIELVAKTFSTCPHLETLYRTGKATDSTGKPIQATGLSSINNLLTLEQIVRSEKPSKTLEVGLAYGGSALAILSTLQSIHQSGSFSHTAIDPGQDSFNHAGKSMVEVAGFASSFKCIEKSSAIALMLWMTKCGEPEII